MVGSAIFTTDSSIYEMVDAMMVTASTHGLLLSAQSVALTDRIAASSHGRDFGFGMQDHMCLAAVKTNTAHACECIRSSKLDWRRRGSVRPRAPRSRRRGGRGRGVSREFVHQQSRTVRPDIHEQDIDREGAVFCHFLSQKVGNRVLNKHRNDVS